MIRQLLAVMAGLICGVMGMRQAQHIRQENATLRRWEIILRQLCLILQEGALPLPEALDQAADEATPADMLLRGLSARLRAEPLSSLSQLYAPQGKEGPVLARLFAGLAQGSLESRLLAATQAVQEIALLAETSQSKAKQDAHMWATLGWTCGACLTLMLL